MRKILNNFFYFFSKKLNKKFPHFYNVVSPKNRHKIRIFNFFVLSRYIFAFFNLCKAYRKNRLFLYHRKKPIITFSKFLKLQKKFDISLQKKIVNFDHFSKRSFLTNLLKWIPKKRFLFFLLFRVKTKNRNIFTCFSSISILFNQKILTFLNSGKCPFSFFNQDRRKNGKNQWDFLFSYFRIKKWPKKRKKIKKFFFFLKKFFLIRDGDFSFYYFILSLIKLRRLGRNAMDFYKAWIYFYSHHSIKVFFSSKNRFLEWETFFFEISFRKQNLANHFYEEIIISQNFYPFFSNRGSKRFFFFLKNISIFLIKSSYLKKRNALKKVFFLKNLKRKFDSFRNFNFLFSGPKKKKKFFFLFLEDYLTSKKKNIQHLKKPFLLETSEGISGTKEILGYIILPFSCSTVNLEKNNKIFFEILFYMLIGGLKNRIKFSGQLLKKISGTYFKESFLKMNPLVHNFLTLCNLKNIIVLNKKKVISLKKTPCSIVRGNNVNSIIKDCDFLLLVKSVLKKRKPLEKKRIKKKNFLKIKKEQLYWLSDNLSIRKSIKAFFSLLHKFLNSKHTQYVFCFFFLKNFCFEKEDYNKNIIFFMKIVLYPNFTTFSLFSKKSVKKNKIFENVMGSCFFCFWKIIKKTKKEVLYSDREKPERQNIKFLKKFPQHLLTKQVQKKLLFFFFFERSFFFHKKEEKKRSMKHANKFSRFFRRKRFQRHDFYSYFFKFLDRSSYSRTIFILIISIFFKDLYLFKNKKDLNFTSVNTKKILFFSITNRDPILELFSHNLKKKMRKLSRKNISPIKNLTFDQKIVSYFSSFRKKNFLYNFLDRVVWAKHLSKEYKKSQISIKKPIKIFSMNIFLFQSIILKINEQTNFLQKCTQKSLLKKEFNTSGYFSYTMNGFLMKCYSGDLPKMNKLLIASNLFSKSYLSFSKILVSSLIWVFYLTSCFFSKLLLRKISNSKICPESPKVSKKFKRFFGSFFWFIKKENKKLGRKFLNFEYELWNKNPFGDLFFLVALFFFNFFAKNTRRVTQALIVSNIFIEKKTETQRYVSRKENILKFLKFLIKKAQQKLIFYSNRKNLRTILSFHLEKNKDRRRIFLDKNSEKFFLKKKSYTLTILVKSLESGFFWKKNFNLIFYKIFQIFINRKVNFNFYDKKVKILYLFYRTFLNSNSNTLLKFLKFLEMFKKIFLKLKEKLFIFQLFYFGKKFCSSFFTFNIFSVLQLRIFSKIKNTHLSVNLNFDQFLKNEFSKNGNIFHFFLKLIFSSKLTFFFTKFFLSNQKNFDFSLENNLEYSKNTNTKYFFFNIFKKLEGFQFDFIFKNKKNSFLIEIYIVFFFRFFLRSLFFNKLLEDSKKIFLIKLFFQAVKSLHQKKDLNFQQERFGIVKNEIQKKKFIQFFNIFFFPRLRLFMPSKMNKLLFWFMEKNITEFILIFQKIKNKLEKTNFIFSKFHLLQILLILKIKKIFCYLSSRKKIPKCFFLSKSNFLKKISKIFLSIYINEQNYLKNKLIEFSKKNFIRGYGEFFSETLNLFLIFYISSKRKNLIFCLFSFFLHFSNSILIFSILNLSSEGIFTKNFEIFKSLIFFSKHLFQLIKKNSKKMSIFVRMIFNRNKTTTKFFLLKTVEKLLSTKIRPKTFFELIYRTIFHFLKNKNKIYEAKVSMLITKYFISIKSNDLKFRYILILIFRLSKNSEFNLNEKFFSFFIRIISTLPNFILTYFSKLFILSILVKFVFPMKIIKMILWGLSIKLFFFSPGIKFYFDIRKKIKAMNHRHKNFIISEFEIFFLQLSFFFVKKIHTIFINNLINLSKFFKNNNNLFIGKKVFWRYQTFFYGIIKKEIKLFFLIPFYFKNLLDISKKNKKKTYVLSDFFFSFFLENYFKKFFSGNFSFFQKLRQNNFLRKKIKNFSKSIKINEFFKIHLKIGITFFFSDLFYFIKNSILNSKKCLFTSPTNLKNSNFCHENFLFLKNDLFFKYYNLKLILENHLNFLNLYRFPVGIKILRNRNSKKKKCPIFLKKFLILILVSRKNVIN